MKKKVQFTCKTPILVNELDVKCTFDSRNCISSEIIKHVCIAENEDYHEHQITLSNHDLCIFKSDIKYISSLVGKIANFINGGLIIDMFQGD